MSEPLWIRFSCQEGKSSNGHCEGLDVGGLNLAQVSGAQSKTSAVQSPVVGGVLCKLACKCSAFLYHFEAHDEVHRHCQQSSAAIPEHVPRRCATAPLRCACGAHLGDSWAHAWAEAQRVDAGLPNLAKPIRQRRTWPAAMLDGLWLSLTQHTDSHGTGRQGRSPNE
jgi:hypothetical protein